VNSIEARLVEEHHRFSLEYSHAIRELNRARRTVNRAEYERLRSIADDAKAKSEAAGVAVKRHVAEHGC